MSAASPSIPAILLQPFKKQLLSSLHHPEAEASQLSELLSHHPLCVWISSIPLKIYLQLPAQSTDPSLQLCVEYPSPQDPPPSFSDPHTVYLSGELSAFLHNIRLLSSGKKSSFQGLSVSGDMAALQGYALWFSLMPLHWEALLVPYCGEVLSHQIGTGARRISALLRTKWARLFEQTQDYIHYESGLFASALDLELFCNEVDALQRKTDALLRRAARLPLPSGPDHDLAQ